MKNLNAVEIETHFGWRLVSLAERYWPADVEGYLNGKWSHSRVFPGSPIRTRVPQPDWHNPAGVVMPSTTLPIGHPHGRLEDVYRLLTRQELSKPPDEVEFYFTPGRTWMRVVDLTLALPVTYTYRTSKPLIPPNPPRIDWHLPGLAHPPVPAGYRHVLVAELTAPPAGSVMCALCGDWRATDQVLDRLDPTIPWVTDAPLPGAYDAREYPKVHNPEEIPTPGKGWRFLLISERSSPPEDTEYCGGDATSPNWRPRLVRWACITAPTTYRTRRAYPPRSLQPAAPIEAAGSCSGTNTGEVTGKVEIPTTFSDPAGVGTPGLGYRFLLDSEREKPPTEGVEFWSPTYDKWKPRHIGSVGEHCRPGMTYRIRTAPIEVTTPDWHNPENVPAPPPGGRFLLKSELSKPPSDTLLYLERGDWSVRDNDPKTNPCRKNFTYSTRTPLPVTTPQEAPEDPEHNPEGATQAQLEPEKGWRFLRASEVKKTPGAVYVFYKKGHFSTIPYTVAPRVPVSSAWTYRTRAPLPSGDTVSLGACEGDQTPQATEANVQLNAAQKEIQELKDKLVRATEHNGRLARERQEATALLEASQKVVAGMRITENAFRDTVERLKEAIRQVASVKDTYRVERDQAISDALYARKTSEVLLKQLNETKAEAQARRLDVAQYQAELTKMKAAKRQVDNQLEIWRVINSTL